MFKFTIGKYNFEYFFKVILRVFLYSIAAFIIFLWLVNTLKFPELNKEIASDDVSVNQDFIAYKKESESLKKQLVSCETDLNTKKILATEREQRINYLVGKIENKEDKKSTSEEKFKTKDSSLPSKKIIDIDLSGQDLEITFIGYIKYLLNKRKDILFFEMINDKSNVVIPYIYETIFFAFLVQFWLLALSNYYHNFLYFINKERLDRIFLYASEWTVNSPPVLGVVGAIFAFGMRAANSDSDLHDLFKNSFALTTILGGCIYVANLFLNIFMVDNISVKNTQAQVKSE